MYAWHSIYVCNDQSTRIFLHKLSTIFAKNCLRYRPHAGRQLATGEAVAADQIHSHPRSGSSTCALWPSGADRLRSIDCLDEPPAFFSIFFPHSFAIYNAIGWYIILICTSFQTPGLPVRRSVRHLWQRRSNNRSNDLCKIWAHLTLIHWWCIHLCPPWKRTWRSGFQVECPWWFVMVSDIKCVLLWSFLLSRCGVSSSKSGTLVT